ncbi:hypothetical protein BDR06DRAFT_522787 [Suillus hirtellus]|nr:hypothetical protein BDR06DRAFT_522787 [Suillus hirtellus]
MKGCTDADSARFGARFTSSLRLDNDYDVAFVVLTAIHVCVYLHSPVNPATCSLLRDERHSSFARNHIPLL